MALSLVGGAAIGALFGALYDVVKISIGKTAMQYKPLLRDLKFTLDSLRPRIIQQIGEHNVELSISNEDIESLQRQMVDGTKLVRMLSNRGMWSCYILCSCCNCNKPSYAKQLVELDRSLRILLCWKYALKLQEARDVKEVLLLARKINDKQGELERRLADLLKVQQESGDGGESSGSGAETTPNEQNGENGGQQVAPSGGGVGAAALGAEFGVLFDTVMQVEDKTTMLKRPLGDLKSTLDSVKPLIEEVAECSKILNLPKDELEDVRMQMEKGAELVSNCSKVRQWSSYKTYEYTNKLLGLDESLQRLLTVLRVQLARDVRECLVSVSNIEAVIDQIEGSGVVKLQNEQNEAKGSCEAPTAMAKSAVGLNALSVEGTRDVTETLDPEANIKAGWRKVEESRVAQSKTEHPSRAVGLDAMNMQVEARTMEETSVSDVEAGHKRIQGKEVSKLDAPFRVLGKDTCLILNLRMLNTRKLRGLKRFLLNDEVSAVVLTGPGGSGKTTLAKFFCEDEEVKNIFKNNIFFVHVSENPNLSIMVQTLYQQMGFQIPALQDESIALHWLHQFLMKTALHPSMLVLDDVWPGSESLLDKFDEFKTPNYKIMVTSRYEFPAFGFPYYLKPLNAEDEMTLSHHSRAHNMELLDDEDLICVSPPPITFDDEGPITHFPDSSASYLGDGSSHVSTAIRPMDQFHDSSVSTLGDKSSYVPKDAGTMFEPDNPVKSTQTYMQQKLELKVSANDKAMKKVMKAVHAIKVILIFFA
ncbi:hypothetical protein D8674_029219 [Pyrus ussuriensis x Pyrus communis]|uniref:RPW8 domain-containing protein n=1 Tax=Pyrus ussuriensis x Pyrus communis TaxID=2448454 RepID=A0A5N5I3G9_9ROSA|nr:hypothetical protein D8674_029219 [Pyrus ussuriensis x Pyrus communis]